MDAMIDLETLSLRAEAVISQIAAVLFEPLPSGEIDVNGAFSSFVRIEGQQRAVDESTLLWWMGQPMEVLETLVSQVPKAPPLDQVLTSLHLWWGPPEPRLVWARGTRDFTWMQHACGQYGLETPWHHRQERDQRTLYDLHEEHQEAARRVLVRAEGLLGSPFRKHDALHDCVLQALVVQEARGA